MEGATWEIIEITKNMFFPTDNHISQLFNLLRCLLRNLRKKGPWYIPHSSILDIRGDFVPKYLEISFFETII